MCALGDHKPTRINLLKYHTETNDNYYTTLFVA